MADVAEAMECAGKEEEGKEEEEEEEAMECRGATGCGNGVQRCN